jgi:tetratricopeptide (TPR) repeat protein
LRRAASEAGDAAAHRALGDAFAERRRPFSAIWVFQDALEREPGDFVARFSIASALGLARLPAEAAGEVAPLLREHPDHELARLLLARAHRAVGRPDLALATLVVHPTALTPALLLEKGRSAQALGRFSEARMAFETCARQTPEDAAPLHRLGRLFLEMGRPADAIATLRAAREKSPQDAGILCDLALALRKARASLDEVGAMLTEAVRLRPTHAIAWQELGRLYQSTGRLPQAAQAYAQAIRADSAAAEPHRLMSGVMTAMGRREDALYHLGLYHLTREQPRRAVTTFRALAARKPADPEPVLMASLSYVKMRQNLPAVREVVRARDRFPRDPGVRERLAMLSVLTNDHPLARQVCEAWRADDATDGRPLWILGRIAANESRWEEAVALHEQAMHLTPDRPDIPGDLARALTEAGGEERLARAREVLTVALRRWPEESDLWLQRGVTLQAMQQWEPAREAYLQALDLSSRSTQAMGALVQLASRLGRAARVDFYSRLLRRLQNRSREEDRRWTRLWEGPGDPRQFLEFARFSLAAGELRKAAYHLENALELRPGWTEAQRQLTLVRGLQRVQ